MGILIPIMNKSSVMDEELERIRAKRMEEIKKRIMGPPSPPDGIVILSQNNFHRVIHQYPRIIVDFWAPWCGPCQMLTPVIEQLSAVYSGKILFGKCNTDENQQIAGQYGISAIPALLFYENGNIVHTIAGALPKEQLMGVIQAVYQVSPVYE